MNTTLYRFFDADGRLLYVGITHRLNERLSAHKRQKPWEHISKIALEHYESREEAMKAEAHAIKNEGPKWNVQGNGAAPTHASLLDVRADPLVGLCFHAIREHDDGCRTADKQGIVTGVVGERYLVQWFDWGLGNLLWQELVNIREMEGWRFYDSDEQLRDAYEYGGLMHAAERHYDHRHPGE